MSWFNVFNKFIKESSLPSAVGRMRGGGLAQQFKTHKFFKLFFLSLLINNKNAQAKFMPITDYYVEASYYEGNFSMLVSVLNKKEYDTIKNVQLVNLGTKKTVLSLDYVKHWIAYVNHYYFNVNNSQYKIYDHDQDARLGIRYSFKSKGKEITCSTSKIHLNLLKLRRGIRYSVNCNF